MDQFEVIIILVGVLIKIIWIIGVKPLPQSKIAAPRARWVNKSWLNQEENTVKPVLSGQSKTGKTNV